MARIFELAISHNTRYSCDLEAIYVISGYNCNFTVFVVILDITAIWQDNKLLSF